MADSGTSGARSTEPRGIAAPLAAFLVFGAFWGGWAVLVPAVQTAVGASKGGLGLALLGTGIGALAAMLAFGRLVDRGLPRPVPTSLAAFAAAALLPAFASSVLTLAAALVVVGACSGVLDVAIKGSCRNR